MDATKDRQLYEDFSGGLNTRLSPIRIPKNQESVLNNCVVNNTGILEKINGYLKDGAPFPNNTDSFIRFLLNLKIGTSVDILLMAAQDNADSNSTFKVDFKKTTGDGTYSYIGFTTPGTATFVGGNASVSGTLTTWLSQLKPGDKIKATADSNSAYTEILSVNSDTSLTLVSGYLGSSHAAAPWIARAIWNKNNIPRGVVFDGKAVITNGSEVPMTYNNISLQLITDANAPKGKYIEAHKSRVFIANAPGNNSTIYWSNVNNEQVWNGASLEPIFPQDGGAIVAIKSFGDSLVVFKNTGNTNAIYQVIGSFDQDDVGTPDFIRRIDAHEHIGIIAERSPVVHNGLLYFLAETGLYVIDQRMNVQKVTYDIDSIVRGFSYSLGPQTSKAYVFNSNATWNAGSSNDGTVARNGALQGFFDEDRETDALQTPDGASVFVAPNNDVHVAYISSSNNKVITYLKYAASDASVSKATAVTTAESAVYSVSIAVAPNGTIGIAYKTERNSNASALYYIVENVSGSWGAETLIFDTGQSFRVQDTGISLCYKANSDPRVAVSQGTGTNGSRASYVKRVAGVWSTIEIDGASVGYNTITMILDGSDHAYTSFQREGTNAIYFSKTTDDGLTFSAITQVLISGATDIGNGNIQIALDASNNPFVVGVLGSGTTDAKKLFKADFSTGSPTYTIIDSTVPCCSSGFAFYDDTADTNIGTHQGSKFFYHYAKGNNDKYIYDSTIDLNDPINGQVKGTVRQPSRGLHNNGPVFGSIMWGTNANEIIIRRVAFHSTWTSPTNSDSTLSSWGTYAVGAIGGTGTLAHQIALDPTTPTVFNPIIPGALISSDPTLVAIKNRIVFTVTTFSTFTLASIADNFTAAGVDAKQIVGVEYLNEVYYSGDLNMASANNTSLILDKFGAFLQCDYAVSAMEIFKSRLYAGRSTNGDLLVLQQGFNFSGSSYTSDAQFKEDFLGIIEQEKDINKIYILFSIKPTGNLIFSYRLDSFATSGGSSWIATTIDQTQNGFADILVGAKARSIQCRVQNSDLDGEMGLVSFVISHGPMNVR